MSTMRTTSARARCHELGAAQRRVARAARAAGAAAVDGSRRAGPRGVTTRRLAAAAPSRELGPGLLRGCASRRAREARALGADRGCCHGCRPTSLASPALRVERGSASRTSTISTRPGHEALSRLQLPDLHIPVTRRTLKYVRFFTRTDRGRGMFETWLKRSGRYQDMIQGELRERAPARGSHLGGDDRERLRSARQVARRRGRALAVHAGDGRRLRPAGTAASSTSGKNPRLATQAAAHHLRDLYLRFGSWDLALAAYNMGYEQLLNAIDTYGHDRLQRARAAAGDPRARRRPTSRRSRPRPSSPTTSSASASTR